MWTRVVRFEVDGAEPAWLADLPTDPPEPGPHVINPLGGGVYLVEYPAGGVPGVRVAYHGILVELDDGFAVLETPETLDVSELTRLIGSLSSKPIILAIPTHHHEDHAFGILDLARHGTEIRTTLGNVELFRRIVASPRMLSGMGLVSPEPRVTALESGAQIGPVRIFDVGPSGHADEHLAFYFPENQMLFQSDMHTATCRLLVFIESEGLAVERILSSHGGERSMDALRASVAASEEACPR